MFEEYKEKRVPNVFIKPEEVFNIINASNSSHIEIKKHKLNIKNIRWLYKKFKNEKEIRCSICGCKASHFRIVKQGNDTFLHLYGFKKEKNITKYVLFNKDHIVPKSLNGKDGNYNIQCTCFDCNTKKGHKIPYEEKYQDLIVKQKKYVKSIVNDFLSLKYKSTPSMLDNMIKNSLLKIIREHYAELEKSILIKLGYISENNN